MAELIKVVIQQLAQAAAVVGSPRLFSVNGVKSLVPKDTHSIQDQHRSWQNLSTGPIVLDEVYESHNWEEHSHARKEVWGHSLYQ
jgi:hypothetical protein